MIGLHTSVSAINVCHNLHLSPVILQKQSHFDHRFKRKERKKAPYSHCRPIITAYNA